MRSVFLSSIRILLSGGGFLKHSFPRTRSPLTGGPSGVHNIEVRCHRALSLCGACSFPPYSSFKWMWTPITWFSKEICSPITGGPSSGGSSEVQCHRALILCGACFSSPYACFEWMWTLIT